MNEVFSRVLGPGPLSSTAPGFPWTAALTHEQARLQNVLSRPREPLSFEWPDGQRAHLKCCAIDAESDIQRNASGFRIAIGAGSILLYLDVAAWEALIGPRQTAFFHKSCSHLAQAIWLEYIALALVKRIEACLGCRIECAVPSRENESPNVLLNIALPDRSIGIPCCVDGPAIDWLENCPPSVWPLQPVADGQVVVPVQWLYGYQDLTLAECRSLRHGDVVMFTEPVRPHFVIGERLMAAARASQPVLQSDLTRLPSHGDLFMADTNDGLSNDDNDADDMSSAIDDMPIRLTCQIGQIMLSLSDVRALAQGSVLPFDKSPDAVIDILLNGHKLGQGSLIRLGDGVGVRIDTLKLDD